MSNCPSWEHREPELAEPGRLTCARHQAEEGAILQTRADLDELSNEIARYKASRMHPDEAKEFVEPAIRAFFTKGIADFGLKCASGFREGEQLDIIATLEEPGGGPEWSVDLRVRQHVETARLLLHAEIAYRTNPANVYRKLREEPDRLDRSVAQAIRQDAPLPWTGMIMVGPAWAPREQALGRLVHERYHGKTIRRVTLAAQEWWPLPDVFVSPSFLLKKDDLFRVRALSGKRVPCYFRVPTSGEMDLQPLAVARVYLRHRVEVILKKAAPESAPWGEGQAAAILGPRSFLAELGPADLETVLVQDAPPSLVLWYDGLDRGHDRRVPVRFKMQARPICAARSPYRARPSADG